MRAPASAARRRGFDHLAEPLGSHLHHRRLGLVVRYAGAPLEHGQRRVEERPAPADDRPERACVRPVQVDTSESAVPPIAARGVVGEDGLAVLLAFHLRQQAGAERSDVLDAGQAVVEERACLEQLEVRGRDHVSITAHVDHSFRAAERQAVVDLIAVAPCAIARSA